MKLGRAHCLGPKRGTTRPIVAKFSSFKEREVVRKATPTLRGQRLGVAEQFPKEIADRRKALFPVMRAAKAAG